MKKNIKKICISTIISIILSIITVILIMQKGINLSSIGIIIMYVGIFDFIAFHFMFGFKKLYDYIIEKRFIIAIILVILSSVVGIMINIGSNSFIDCIKDTDLLLSPWWNLKFYALVLSLYELFLLITDKNKYLSIAGSVIVTFSSCVVYNFTKIDALFFGSIIVILIDKILNSEKIYLRIIFCFLSILCSIFYSYTFIPYAISFGYIFIALIIYIVLKNKDNIKSHKYDLICVFLFSILGMACSKIIIKNNYTEEIREKLTGYNLMFSYLYNIFLPYKNIPNKEIFASICGIAPVPIIISLWYLYKREEHIKFLMPITVISVLEIVYCFMGFPEVLNKILLLEQVNIYRMMSAIQFANLLIMFYFIGCIKEKLFSVKVNMRITIVFLILLVFVVFPTDISSRLYLTLYIVELTSFIFSFLNMEETGYRKALVVLLILITLISGVPVNLLV